MSAINYRTATIDDASAIGALHVASWRETYAGLIPRDILDALSAESRAAMWATVLDISGGTVGTKVFVAETPAGIVGFGACGDQRDEAMRERGFSGEIGAIYILRSYQRAAIGSALMNLMARDLMARRLTSASLWVLRENTSARSFYEKLGGDLMGEKTISEGNTTLSEVAYGWPDLSRLVLIATSTFGVSPSNRER